MNVDIKHDSFLWDIHAESLAAIFAKRIEEIRGIKAEDIVQELNYKYLKKRDKTTFDKCTPTKNQRDILKNRGY